MQSGAIHPLKDHFRGVTEMIEIGKAELTDGNEKIFVRLMTDEAFRSIVIKTLVTQKGQGGRWRVSVESEVRALFFVAGGVGPMQKRG